MSVNPSMLPIPDTYTHRNIPEEGPGSGLRAQGYHSPAVQSSAKASVSLSRQGKRVAEKIKWDAIISATCQPHNNHTVPSCSPLPLGYFRNKEMLFKEFSSISKRQHQHLSKWTLRLLRRLCRHSSETQISGLLQTSYIRIILFSQHARLDCDVQAKVKRKLCKA